MTGKKPSNAIRKQRDQLAIQAKVDALTDEQIHTICKGLERNSPDYTTLIAHDPTEDFWVTYVIPESPEAGVRLVEIMRIWRSTSTRVLGVSRDECRACEIEAYPSSHGRIVTGLALLLKKPKLRIPCRVTNQKRIFDYACMLLLTLWAFGSQAYAASLLITFSNQPDPPYQYVNNTQVNPAGFYLDVQNPRDLQFTLGQDRWGLQLGTDQNLRPYIDLAELEQLDEQNRVVCLIFGEIHDYGFSQMLDVEYDYLGQQYPLSFGIHEIPGQLVPEPSSAAYCGIALLCCWVWWLLNEWCRRGEKAYKSNGEHGVDGYDKDWAVPNSLSLSSSEQASVSYECMTGHCVDCSQTYCECNCHAKSSHKSLSRVG